MIREPSSVDAATYIRYMVQDYLRWGKKARYGTISIQFDGLETTDKLSTLSELSVDEVSTGRCAR